MKDEATELMLYNVRVKYAKVVRPGKAYDESKPDEWSVNLYPDPEGDAALRSNKCTPKMDKEGGEFYVAKRATKNTKGDDVKPPLIVDGAKNPWNGSDIGNGSVCNVKVTLFPWERKGRKGVYIYLNAMQVVNHVPYVAGGADGFDVVDTSTAKEDDMPF